MVAGPGTSKSGRISPTKAKHVKKQLPDIDYILDGGPTKFGIESTVIGIQPDGFIILRQGMITREELENVLPQSKQTAGRKELRSSPGNIKSHYSPQKPLYILGEHPQGLNTENAAFLSFGKVPDSRFRVVEYLSKNGDLHEAAIYLFHLIL